MEDFLIHVIIPVSSWSRSLSGPPQMIHAHPPMKLPSFKGFLGLCLVLALSPGLLAAELNFSRHYGDGMVLQRDQPVTLRGFAGKGATVKITFAGQSKETKANGDGEWQVTLDAMPANAAGAELIASSGANLAKLGDRKSVV